jgi:hypothetical protein
MKIRKKGQISNMQRIPVAELEYYILSGKPNSLTPPYLHAAVKEFWAEEWVKIFEKIDADFRLDTDDFERQSRVTALVHQGKILGIQTLCDYSLKDIDSHSYFQPYSPDFIAELKKRNLITFQAMKYFLVGEKYGVRATGLNLAAIILGLSFNQQKYFDFDATITLARKDVASASTAAKFNMLQVGADIEMHNVPVGQLLCLEPTRYPRPEVADAVDLLWSRRRDYSRRSEEISLRPREAEL